MRATSCTGLEMRRRFISVGARDWWQRWRMIRSPQWWCLVHAFAYRWWWWEITWWTIIWIPMEWFILPLVVGTLRLHCMVLWPDAHIASAAVLDDGDQFSFQIGWTDLVWTLESGRFGLLWGGLHLDHFLFGPSLQDWGPAHWRLPFILTVVWLAAFVRRIDDVSPRFRVVGTPSNWPKYMAYKWWWSDHHWPIHWEPILQVVSVSLHDLLYIFGGDEKLPSYTSDLRRYIKQHLSLRFGSECFWNFFLSHLACKSQDTVIIYLQLGCLGCITKAANRKEWANDLGNIWNPQE